MTSSQPLVLPGYAHVYSGKVRDLYAPLDESGAPRGDQLLLVASDRMSAYDFVLDTPIPDKGAVLTQLSLWWFERLTDLVPNHVVSTDVPAAVAGRAVLVRRLEMLPVECVARAYLTGGGLQRVPRRRARLRGGAARGARRRVAPAGAGLHPLDQGADGRARPAHAVRRRRGRDRRRRSPHASAT